MECNISLHEAERNVWIQIALFNQREVTFQNCLDGELLIMIAQAIIVLHLISWKVYDRLISGQSTDREKRCQGYQMRFVYV